MVGFVLWGCAAGSAPPGEPGLYTTAAHHLTLGEYLLRKGDYQGARRESNLVLGRFPGRADDRALHLLGMVLIHPHNPDGDPSSAADCFQRIVDHHPDSPLVAEAQTWLALIARLEDRNRTIARMEKTVPALEQQLKAEAQRRRQLEERLQQMKAVDLTIE